jgi:hypothetical protein
VTDNLEEAWQAVYAVLPPEWAVTKPVHHPELGSWVAYARNTRYRKTGVPFVEAVGPTEPRALHELARCIVEVLAGRVPK